MKKFALFSTVMLALTLFSAHAQNTLLYGTYNDWQAYTGAGDGWFGYTVQAVSNFSYGNITVNGLGDTNAAAVGQPGTNGALEISPAVAGWGPMFATGGQSLPWIQALDGQYATSSFLTNQSGTMIVTYTVPDHSNDTNASTNIYFQLGIYVNAAFTWSDWGSSSTVDLGPVSTPYGTQELMEAVMPYTIPLYNQSYWCEFGFFENTDNDYNGTNPWYITSWYVVPIPESITAAAINNLFSTSNDFALATGVNGFTVQADGTWNSTNIIVNGFGNTSFPGNAGLAGSLLVNWPTNENAGSGGTNSIWSDAVNLPSESGNNPFQQAVDTASGLSVPAYGNIYIDFTQPDTTGGGSYFQLGFSFAWPGSGWWDSTPYFSSSVTDLGYQDDNGEELFRATIPYILAGGQEMAWMFSPYVWVNSDYHPANPFHIANISASCSAAPVITNFSLTGSGLLIQGNNGLAGSSFTVFSTTNLAKPFAQWSVVGSPGNPFAGPGWSITDTTVNTATKGIYYVVKAGH